MESALIHTGARVLEFESLRDLVRGYAASPLGQGRTAALSPSVDRRWIENQHQLTVEIREFRRVGGRFEFSGLIDISTTVEKSRIQGAVLETTEIRNVVLVVDRAAEWREVALSPPAAMKVKWTAVEELSSAITDFTEFLRAFRNKLQPDGTLEDRASPELARIRREMERWLDAGQTCGVPKTEGTCREILKRRQALGTFVRHPGVEPTNNTAERAIRPGVLWRKGSFGTHSPDGSRFVEAMMTVVATLKPQHCHVLDYLTAACTASLSGQPIPSLLPTPAAIEQLIRPAA